jgi:UDP-N-acetylmuramoylalanine--D-glutamate ligase
VLARRAITSFEMSSYQCHDLDAGPDVAILLNLFPEHMDWHGSVTAYYDAKCRLAALQRPEALTVFDAESAEIARRLPLGPARHVGFGARDGAGGAARFEAGAFWRGSERLFDDSRMRLRGLHNRRNACAALEAALALGAAAPHVLEALASFTGLPHRLEEVQGRGGIRFIDDSISTAPESAVAALEAHRGSVATLIAGGHDRGYDFAPLVDAILADGVATVICLPPSGLRLAANLRDRAVSSGPRVIEASTLEDAVTAALRETPSGRTCLFSPASPSYGAFRDFQERGMKFRDLIR